MDASVKEVLNGYGQGPVKEVQQNYGSPINEVLVVMVAQEGLVKLFFWTRGAVFWKICWCKALSGSAIIGGYMQEFYNGGSQNAEGAEAFLSTQQLGNCSSSQFFSSFQPTYQHPLQPFNQAHLPTNYSKEYILQFHLSNTMPNCSSNFFSFCTNSGARETQVLSHLELYIILGWVV